MPLDELFLVHVKLSQHDFPGLHKFAWGAVTKTRRLSREFGGLPESRWGVKYGRLLELLEIQKCNDRYLNAGESN